MVQWHKQPYQVDQERLIEEQKALQWRNKDTFANILDK